jgi:hypothetical protein
MDHSLLHHVDDVSNTDGSNDERSEDKEPSDVGRASGGTDVATEVLSTSLEGKKNGRKAEDEVEEAANQERLQEEARDVRL